MPEHLRALVVILVITTVTFAVARRRMVPGCMDAAAFRHRSRCWIGLTLVAFLANNFWIYAAGCLALLASCQASERRRYGLFLFLILCLPRVTETVPGFGVLDSLFEVDYQRFLVAAVLAPLALRTSQTRGTAPLGRLVPDVFLLLYLLLDLILAMRAGTVTSVLRSYLFEPAVDQLLPYYVASRALTNLKLFRDALASFVTGAAVISMILLFEFLRGWLLYQALNRSLGTSWTWSHYLQRGGSLRAVGTMGQPIVAGSVIMVALGFDAFTSRFVKHPYLRVAGRIVLVLGLIGALSRAPWVAAAGATVLYLAMGPRPVRNLAICCGAAIAAVPVLVTTDIGQRFIDLLPWVGTVEANTVEGRATLFSTSYVVFLKNPWFGRPDFINDPLMETLRDGTGTIDVVNSFIQVALRAGGVGLFLFSMALLSALWMAIRAWRTVRNRHGHEHSLGRSLVTTLIAYMFIITTLSSVMIVPLMYWTLAGLCVGYATMIKQRGADSRPRRAGNGRQRRSHGGGHAVPAG